MKINCKQCIEGQHLTCTQKDCLCEENEHYKELESRSDKEVEIVTELKQLIVKEMMNHIDLAHVRKEMFSEILKYRISCNNEGLKIIDQMLSRLFDIRLRKLSLLFKINDIKSVRIRMTDNEIECWETCNHAIRLLKTVQYGVKQND